MGPRTWLTVGRQLAAMLMEADQLSVTYTLLDICLQGRSEEAQREFVAALIELSVAHKSLSTLLVHTRARARVCVCVAQSRDRPSP